MTRDIKPAATVATPALIESHAARAARHAEARQALDSERDAQVARGKALIGEAQDRHFAAHPALVAAQKAEITEAKICVQRLAADRLRPVVTDFIEQPSRATARAAAAVFQELEAASLHSVGAQLDRELGHAMAAAMVEANPESLPRFALLDAYAGLGSCAEESYAASRACRMTGATSAGLVEDALRALERKIAAIAESGSRAKPEHAAAFFDAIRFSGGPNEAREAIAEIEKADRERIAVEACKVAARHPGWSVLRGLSGLVESLSPSDDDSPSAA